MDLFRKTEARKRAISQVLPAFCKLLCWLLFFRVGEEPLCCIFAPLMWGSGRTCLVGREKAESWAWVRQ
jgi:hypothetical protein